ncbi:MAG: hypothetical protein R2838_06690 [Caldilineaceae bacterium]
MAPTAANATATHRTPTPHHLHTSRRLWRGYASCIAPSGRCAISWPSTPFWAWPTRISPPRRHHGPTGRRQDDGAADPFYAEAIEDGRITAADLAAARSRGRSRRRRVPHDVESLRLCRHARHGRRVRTDAHSGRRRGG